MAAHSSLMQAFLDLRSGRVRPPAAATAWRSHRRRAALASSKVPGK